MPGSTAHPWGTQSHTSIILLPLSDIPKFGLIGRGASWKGSLPFQLHLPFPVGTVFAMKHAL